MRTAVALMLITGACGSTDSVREEHVAALAFNIPSTWDRNEVQPKFGQRAEWRPERNNRHEALTIVRTEQSAAIARADRDYLTRLLVQAQFSLPSALASHVTPVTTTKGLSGVRIAVDFVPIGSKLTYHRVHVLLVDGDALVNVLYTARDPELKTLELVLDTIHREEG